MDEAEFDKFASEYRALHESVLGPSGEDAAFFAAYKVAEARRLADAHGLPEKPEIMDFGAGVGTSVPYFLEHFPGCRLTCLDVSHKSLALGRGQHGQAAQFIHFDGQTLPGADASADLVFAACVFHHIPHGEHAGLLGEIARVLRPGGLLLVFEHNPYNFLTVRAVNACEFDANAVLIRGAEFRRRITDAGLHRARLRYRLFFPRALRALRVAEPLLGRLPLGAQYYVAAQKPG